jgi:hypothetical protein
MVLRNTGIQSHHYLTSQPSRPQLETLQKALFCWPDSQDVWKPRFWIVKIQVGNESVFRVLIVFRIFVTIHIS